MGSHIPTSGSGDTSIVATLPRVPSRQFLDCSAWPSAHEAKCNRTSQIWRSKRVVGCGIIAPRRSSSAHLHRPWRATVRFVRFRRRGLPAAIECRTSSPQLCRRSSAARPRRRWLLSRREDARPSAASLGDLRAVARSRVLHGLGLCRRKILTHILGTARGIEGCLGVALELRHHLARD